MHRSMSFAQKGLIKRAMLMVLLACFLASTMAASCGGHQKRVNAISYVMRDFNAAWDVADSGILDLYKKRIVGKEVRGTRDKLAILHVTLNKNWQFVPRTDASIEAFISQPNFQEALRLVIELGEILTANGIRFEFPGLSNFKRSES